MTVATKFVINADQNADVKSFWSPTSFVPIDSKLVTEFKSVVGFKTVGKLIVTF